MATNRKYQNISVQPQSLPRHDNTIFELPSENLIEDELVRKSTSDRTKRRVAHEALFSLPVTRKLEAPMGMIDQGKIEKKHILKKESNPGTKSCKVRKIKETIAVGSTAVHKSMSHEVDDTVQDKKRCISEYEEVMKKKSRLTKSKNKKLHLPKGISTYRNVLPKYEKPNLDSKINSTSLNNSNYQA